MGFPVSSCCSSSSSSRRLNQFNPHVPPTSRITKSSASNNSTQLGMGWYSQQAAEEKRSWKTKRILGIACSIIIGIEMGAACFLIAAAPPPPQHQHQSIAVVALEMVGYEQQQQQHQGGDMKSKAAAGKWSEKRSCFPWHFNSLETVVPEDLPRLYSRRRWQFIIDSSENYHAPPTSHDEHALIKVANQSKKCFSL